MKKLLLIVVGTLFLFSAQAMTSESCSAQSKRSTKSTKSTKSTQPAQSSQSTQKSNENDGWIEVGEVTLVNPTSKIVNGIRVRSYNSDKKPDIQAVLYVKEIAGSVVLRVFYNNKYYLATQTSDTSKYYSVKIDGIYYEFKSPL